MLVYHILIPVICAIIMNGIIYTLKLNKINSKDSNKLYIPQGYIIGIIWTIIFGLLGYVHYLLYKLNNNINFGSVSVALLILFCLSYPVINAINVKHGYFLNLISLILSFIVSLIVMMYSKYIFLYLIPLLIWVSYVNVIFYYNILYLEK